MGWDRPCSYHRTYPTLRPQCLLPEGKFHSICQVPSPAVVIRLPLKFQETVKANKTLGLQKVSNSPNIGYHEKY